MRRREDKNATPFEDVKDLIRNEIQLSSQCIGYRSRWRRLIYDYKMKVERNCVMGLMKEVDPEGVSLRKAHTVRLIIYIPNSIAIRY